MRIDQRQGMIPRLKIKCNVVINVAVLGNKLSRVRHCVSSTHASLDEGVM